MFPLEDFSLDIHWGLRSGYKEYHVCMRWVVRKHHYVFFLSKGAIKIDLIDVFISKALSTIATTFTIQRPTNSLEGWAELPQH